MKFHFLILLILSTVLQAQNRINGRYNTLSKTFETDDITYGIGYFKNGNASISNKGYFGLMDSSGKILCKPKYDEIELQTNGFAIVQLKQYKGMINNRGIEIIPVKYSGIDYFQNIARIFRYSLTEKLELAYVNSEGKFIVPFGKYEQDSRNFIDANFATVEQNKKCGLINNKGIEVLPCIYENAYYYGNGHIIIQNENKKWGIVDFKQKAILPCIYDAIISFKNGIAIVKKENKIVYINSAGIQKETEFDDIRDIRNNGSVAIKNHKWGLVDSVGNETLPCQFDLIGKFDNGNAVVSKDEKYGVINTLGEYVKSLKDTKYVLLENNITIYKENEKYGAFNLREEVVIPFKYDYMNFISNDLLSVKFKNKYGLINKEGKIILPFEYDMIQAYNNSNDADLFPITKNEKTGCINKEGKIVVPLLYDEINFLRYQHVGKFGIKNEIIDAIPQVVVKGGKKSISKYKTKYGLINNIGKVLLNPIYEYIDLDNSSGLHIVKLNGKFGFIDWTSKLIIPCIYEEVEQFTFGKARVKLIDEFIYINKKGVKTSAFF